MRNAVTVSQLNSYIKKMFGKDENLSDILVRGEISNFKKHRSGHMYFTLKDDRAAVSCIMFSSYGFRMSFEPENGMQVTASGYVSVYEKSGQYQLYVSDMMPEGEGALFLKFEKLKKKLSEEGLFDGIHKRKIPYLPECIGVVTSATGSVIKDIQNVMDRRFPGYKMLLYPSNVQGKGAEIEIAAGIEYFNRTKKTDVIIIARGGGSIEDLWPFNEEVLARAIFNSKIPIISAVGHDTDYTIADFVADLRAPTPSAAAELVVPELYVLRDKINTYGSRIRNSLVNSIRVKEKRLELIKSRPVMKRPGEIFDMAAYSIDRSAEKIINAVKSVLNGKEAGFREMAAKVELLSPLGTLARGYAVVSDEDERVITSICDVSHGDILHTKVKDGIIVGGVIGTEDNDGRKII